MKATLKSLFQGFLKFSGSIKRKHWVKWVDLIRDIKSENLKAGKKSKIIRITIANDFFTFKEGIQQVFEFFTTRY